MKNLICIVVVALVFVSQMLFAQTKKTVESFNKVIISPHIETLFIQAPEQIKFLVYGEIKLRYKANASVSRGLNIGDSEIT